MKKVLFVCLGNICRSPAAEAVFKKLVFDAGLSDQFEIDSAGTSAYHKGAPADSRMLETGQQLGYQLTSLSRPIDHADLEYFDIILAMDHSNYYHILDMVYADAQRPKIYTMCQFSKLSDEKDVPDPYYGGQDGFLHVFRLLEDACAGLLDFVKKEG